MKSFGSLIETRTRATLAQDRQIKRVISRIVPAATLSHVQFCRLEGGRLRVTVDSAAWVARLRFTERQLVGALKEQRLDVHTVSFHVAPSEVPVIRTTTRQANRAGVAAARALQSLADSEESMNSQPNSAAGDGHDSANRATAGSHPEDDRLRQELLKLAARLRET